jgi:hypothetical protein
MEMEGTGLRTLPRLSWGPVIAGVLLALAAHVVLGLIGAAIGFAAEPADSRAVGAGAAVWGLITPLVATALGAWLAVRLAGRDDEAGSNLHGVMVWCIGLIAGAIFLAGTAASGTMALGTAASGNAETLRRLTGTRRADVSAPVAEARADEAAKTAAATAGGAAMAGLCGLLGAFIGAGLARRRGEGKGLGFRIAVHRTRADERFLGAERGRAAPMPPEVRDREPPGAPPLDPYHH